jgi:PKD domain
MFRRSVHGRATGRGWRRGLVAVATTLAVLGGATPIDAANQSRSTTISLSGGQNTDTTWNIEGRCHDCIPQDFAAVAFDDEASYDAVVQAQIHLTHVGWTSDATIDIGYDDQLLRQGRTLDLADQLTVTGGTMTATGTISGSMFIQRDGTTNVADFGSFTSAMNLSWACPVPLPGSSPQPCASGNANTTVLSVKILDVTLGKVFLTLKVGASLTAAVSTDGVQSSADLSIEGGGPTDSKTITWAGSSPSTTHDLRALSCQAPAGSDVSYRFTGGSTVQAHQDIASTFKLIGSVVVDPVALPTKDAVDYTFTEVPQAALPLDVGLSGGNSTTLSLGTLAKNNVPPLADAGGGATHAYSGNQGSPITFDGSSSTSACGFPTLRWDFSDGGVAYGKSPQHTFSGSGVYSGLLTATDATGLTSTTTFSVDVQNVAPAVWAGPDTTEAWGRPVSFNGAAIDPGSDDQSTLSYVWAFGDGTPSSSDGPSVQHTYARPGEYVATFGACDRHGLCSQDQRLIVIRKRDVSLGSLGDTAATFGTPSLRHAALVDEFGSSVNGRMISFSVGGTTVGTSTTNSFGQASLTWTPQVDAGTYSADASFAGDAYYTAATGGGSVDVVRKATVLAYTGATSGAPNKAVTLSAVLRDATGTALGGRTVTFVVGSQTVSAATNASGVATASLKLTQKNGTYALSATWVPAGTDAARYTGSAASASFKLQAR